MEIKESVIVGTLESSDCQATVEPGDGKVDFLPESVAIHQFGNQIGEVTLEILKDFGVDNVRISIVDKGALNCTIKVRTEDVMSRAVDQCDNTPWGGAVR